MFIYSVRNADIISGIHFFWCHSFTMFKQSNKSNVRWLIEKFNIKMVKVPFQNNKNWASDKFLNRKSEKMCLPQNFSKIRDVEFQKWHYLCSYIPEFPIYVSRGGFRGWCGVRAAPFFCHHLFFFLQSLWRTTNCVVH